jgi:hypothetical protein
VCDYDAETFNLAVQNGTWHLALLKVWDQALKIFEAKCLQCQEGQEGQEDQECLQWERHPGFWSLQSAWVMHRQTGGVWKLHLLTVLPSTSKINSTIAPLSFCHFLSILGTRNHKMSTNKIMPERQAEPLHRFYTQSPSKMMNDNERSKWSQRACFRASYKML